jgi:hypothetical protein
VLNRLQGVFESFRSHEVRYLVIGGIAAILHGVPRATFDLDILIEATETNAERLLAALRSAGCATATMIDARASLAKEITIFRDRVRLDVQTSTPGIRFEQAWERRVMMAFRGQSFPVLSRADLIASKRAAGRTKDLEDVQLLEGGSGPG